MYDKNKQTKIQTQSLQGVLGGNLKNNLVLTFSIAKIMGINKQDQIVM